MKKLLLFILLLLTSFVIFLTNSYAQCLVTTPGYVNIQGSHRQTVIQFSNRHYITISCTTKRPGYLYWRGGYACLGGYVFGRNFDNSSFWCRITRVK